MAEVKNGRRRVAHDTRGPCSGREEAAAPDAGPHFPRPVARPSVVRRICCADIPTTWAGAVALRDMDALRIKGWSR